MDKILKAMEEYLYQDNTGNHERTNGGWCIDDCKKCARLEVAHKAWRKARTK